MLHEYLQKLCYYMVFPTSSAGNPCKIIFPSNITIEIRLWILKVTGIAGIHAIPINMKSLHSDFPVESL